MKNLLAMAVGTPALLSSGVLFAQSGTMMNGAWSGSGWMGGYGGIWVPVLLIAVVVGLVVWVVNRMGKKSN